METVQYRDYPDEPVELEPLSLTFMRAACFVPLSLEGNHLRLAMCRPDDADTLRALSFAYPYELEPLQGSEDDILAAVERLYGAGSQSLETIIEEAGRSAVDVSPDGGDVDQLIDMASEAPIIRLVNRLIMNAVNSRASDIHFEPFENEFKVRYRIDGILHEAESPPKRLQAAVISRVKIMSRLDIAERRLPQDGRVKLKVGDREIDFRVSTVPTLYGESLVMRILDRENLILDLSEIGFPPEMQARYEDLIRRPCGMVLVTGPTGSGKTSTLYTTLARINSPENKIITLEDPVEYQLRGVNQIQVNARIGLTFAGGLRSIVRQDPDIILVGEIRDRETAGIAVQSALTGHLLFSTLHTNDAAGAVTRLLDMGVENFLLGSTLLGALAQRLVRRICSGCRRTAVPDMRMLRLIQMDEQAAGRIGFQEGTGCDECRGTGYRGRMGLFEYLEVSDTIRELIVQNAAAGEIRDAAVACGMDTLRMDGLRKIREGRTTISEVLRVTVEG
ncbi:MAG: type II secretion system protein GspE [Desulfobacterales bacterium]|nr:MAG: type II secretion system protein GspE [Desulfobacterales bacterium]